MKKIICRSAASLLVAGAVMTGAVWTTSTGLGTRIARADSHNAAQKVTLTRTNRDCFGDIVGTAQNEPFGFALIHRTGSDKLIATVVLQNAAPNTTYNVRLIQTPSGADCTVFDGTLTTNASGNGSTNIQEPLLPGTTDAFVVLNNQANFADFFTTEEVFF